MPRKIPSGVVHIHTSPPPHTHLHSHPTSHPTPSTPPVTVLMQNAGLAFSSCHTQVMQYFQVGRKARRGVRTGVPGGQDDGRFLFSNFSARRNGHQTTDDVPINPGFWVARFTCSSAVSTPGLCSPKNVFSFQSHRVSDKEPSEGCLARRLQFVNFNSNTTWSLKTLEYLKIKKKKRFFSWLTMSYVFKKKKHVWELLL